MDQLRADIMMRAANYKHADGDPQWAWRIGEGDIDTAAKVDEVIKALRDVKAEGPRIAGDVFKSSEARYRVALGLAPKLVAQWDADKDGSISLQEVVNRTGDFRSAVQESGLSTDDLALVVSPILLQRLQSKDVPTREEAFEKAYSVFMNQPTPNQTSARLLVDIAEMAHTAEQRARVTEQAKRIYYSSNEVRSQAIATLAMSIVADTPEGKAAAQELAKPLVTTYDAVAAAAAGAVEARVEPDAEKRAVFIHRVISWAAMYSDEFNAFLTSAKAAAVTKEERQRVFSAVLSGAHAFRYRNLSIAAAMANNEADRARARTMIVDSLALPRETHTGRGAQHATMVRYDLGALAMLTDDDEQRRDIARLASWYAGKMQDHPEAVVAAQRSVELALRPRE